MDTLSSRRHVINNCEGAGGTSCSEKTKLSRTIFSYLRYVKIVLGQSLAIYVMLSIVLGQSLVISVMLNIVQG